MDEATRQQLIASTERELLNIQLELENMTVQPSAAGGKPNAGGPYATDHQGYRELLMKRQASCEARLLSYRGPTVTKHYNGGPG